MLALNVRVGETISFSDRNHGSLGTMRVEHKSGNSVSLIFDVVESFIIRRMMNHQENKIGFGLTGEARGPLRCAEC